MLEQNRLALAALNCSGNQLHPVDRERHSKVVYDTVRVAQLLGRWKMGRFLIGNGTKGCCLARKNWLHLPENAA